ncbi:MAG: hypothetical protein RLN80_08710, partial [Rhodospirillales bacterium]
MADPTGGLLSDELTQSCRKAGAALFEKLVAEAGAAPASPPFMTQVMSAQAEALSRFWRGLQDDPAIAEAWYEKLSGVFFPPSSSEQADAGNIKPDRRFADDIWQNHRGFCQLRNAYDRLSDGLTETAQSLALAGADSGVRGAFLTRLAVEALCPANGLLTNPAALRHIAATDGASFARSLDNLVGQLDVRTGRLAPPMSPPDAFRPGRDIAITPGYVVAENALCQLVVYEPEGGAGNVLPVMIIPPWINKFYILDLRPQNSLIKWLTEQGHTVCVLSWINPGAEMADTDFEDYML